MSLPRILDSRPYLLNMLRFTVSSLYREPTAGLFTVYNIDIHVCVYTLLVAFVFRS